MSDASAIGATDISPISNDEDLSSSSSQQYANIQCMLIEEVRKYQCLWNTTCRSFKETPKKAEAWRRVSVAMKMEGKFFLEETTFKETPTCFRRNNETEIRKQDNLCKKKKQ